MDYSCQQGVNNITHVQRYSSPVVFGILLTMLGVSYNAKEVLISDEITSLQKLVKVYQDDVDSLQSYLKGVNKTYAARQPPIRLNPRVNSRLMGVLHYYTVATNLFHHLPDPMQLTVDLA
jgi:hypothetical protein